MRGCPLRYVVSVLFCFRLLCTDGRLFRRLRVPREARVAGRPAALGTAAASSTLDRRYRHAATTTSGRPWTRVRCPCPVRLCPSSVLSGRQDKDTTWRSAAVLHGQPSRPAWNPLLARGAICGAVMESVVRLPLDRRRDCSLSCGQAGDASGWGDCLQTDSASFRVFTVLV